jgi:hypothetical protein
MGRHRSGLITTFTKVLKKFFTDTDKNENKGGTTASRRRDPMFHQIKTAASRARDTIVLDAIGAAALMITLVGALYLPGTF